MIPDETKPDAVDAPPNTERPLRSLAIAARLTIVLVLLCGVAYPALIYAGAQLAFRANAEGSVLYDGCGVAVGSRLVGQSFTRPTYFWGRPSAVGYDARNSGASNLGPLNTALRDSLTSRAAAFRAANALGTNAPLPADAITGGGSGLDPDISPGAAMLQVQRIASARSAGRDASTFVATLRALVDAHTARPTLGILGEPRVNVLELNLALDSLDDGAHAWRPACGAAAGRSP